MEKQTTITEQKKKVRKLHISKSKNVKMLQNIFSNHADGSELWSL